MSKKIEDWGKAENHESEKNYCEFTVLYADNETYFQELRIVLCTAEWSLLEKQPFFLELIEYLNNREIPGSSGLRF